MPEVSFDELERVFAFLQQSRLFLARNLVLLLWVVNPVFEFLQNVQASFFFDEKGSNMVEKPVEVIAERTLGLFPESRILDLVAFLVQFAEIERFENVAVSQRHATVVEDREKPERIFQVLCGNVYQQYL